VTAVYILQSQSTHRFCVGCAADPLARLAEHQRGHTTSTRGRGPWVLVFQERFDTLTEARLSRATAKKLEITSFDPGIDRNTEHAKLSAPRRLAGEVVGSIPTRSTNSLNRSTDCCLTPKNDTNALSLFSAAWRATWKKAKGITSAHRKPCPNRRALRRETPCSELPRRLGSSLRSFVAIRSRE